MADSGRMARCFNLTGPMPPGRFYTPHSFFIEEAFATPTTFVLTLMLEELSEHTRPSGLSTPWMVLVYSATSGCPATSGSFPRPIYFCFLALTAISIPGKSVLTELPWASKNNTLKILLCTEETVVFGRTSWGNEAEPFNQWHSRPQMLARSRSRVSATRFV